MGKFAPNGQTTVPLFEATVAVDPVTGRPLSSVAFNLLQNAGATGSPVANIPGGSYIWSVQGTFGGATVKLQCLGPDGATFMDIPSASMTSPGQMGVAIGGNAAVKAVVTGGSPSALYSNLS